MILTICADAGKPTNITRKNKPVKKTATIYVILKPYYGSGK
jgi:hypothetical protein